MVVEHTDRVAELREFLAGGRQTSTFVRLDPSSYAAIFVGKPGGDPTVEDQLQFHQAFPNYAAPTLFLDYDRLLPELTWERKQVETRADGTVVWEEVICIPSGERRRVIEHSPGTVPWLVEPAVKTSGDFDLIDFYADRVLENVDSLVASAAKYPPMVRAADMMPAVTLFNAFEVYWLVGYADMPLFYMDWPERYLRSVQKVHAANLALLDGLSEVGFELFFSGSAGAELLSPRIFREAIVPCQREFNNRARTLGRFSSYHICGHSRQVIEDGIVDAIQPTIFETCSERPCGNNEDLRSAVFNVDQKIITKGNVPLELLLNGTPAHIEEAVARVVSQTRGRRHIVGQADCSILAGTPHENIRAFLNAAARQPE